MHKLKQANKSSKKTKNVGTVGILQAYIEKYRNAIKNEDAKHWTRKEQYNTLAVSVAASVWCSLSSFNGQSFVNGKTKAGAWNNYSIKL